VTEDGAFITSDPGVGIIEGGWHFPEPPEEETTDSEGRVKEEFENPPCPLPLIGLHLNPVDGSDGTIAHRTPKQPDGTEAGDGRFSLEGNYRSYPD
jgi:hypothetical protein